MSSSVNQVPTSYEGKGTRTSHDKVHDIVNIKASDIVHILSQLKVRDIIHVCAQRRINIDLSTSLQRGLVATAARNLRAGRSSSVKVELLTRRTVRMRKALIALLCATCWCVVAATPASYADAKDNDGIVKEAASVFPEPDVTARRTGELDVQVLVDGRPVNQYAARGRRYVEAMKGAEYELRISNSLPVRVAVALSVDGLNTIDARRTTSREASKWVIEPYQTITISGWQMSSARARRFYFTSERDSYAAKLGRAADLGVISAVFFRERRAVGVVPRTYPAAEEPYRRAERERKSESAATAAGTGSTREQSDRAIAPAPDDEYAATGIGRSLQHDVRWVRMELDLGPVAEMTLRYEYPAALVKLGILPRAYPNPDPLGRREGAKGFADGSFCPEP